MKQSSICVVCQSFHPYLGGLTRYVNALGKQFIAHGHEFRVIHFKTPSIHSIDFSEGITLVRADIQKNGEELVGKYMEFKEAVLQVTHGQAGAKTRFSERGKLGFSEWLEINALVKERVLEVFDYKPFDLLHIHDFQLLPLARMLRKEKALEGVPIVFTWHIPFTMAIPKEWREFIAGYMNDYDKTILSTSEYVEAAMASGLRVEKAEMVHPFIDLSEYSYEGENDVRKRLGVGSGDVLFACVSRIDPRKGQEVLIKALAPAVAENQAIKCVFVGNGSFSTELMGGKRGARKKKLLGMVARRGLKRNVFFTGYLPDPEVSKVYEACDVGVQPSLHEGFGLTVSEAMCFGKPVVGSRVGGIPVQIRDGVNGRLFQAGDCKALAAILVELAGDPGKRARMGGEGRRIVREKFSSDKGFARHEEIYGRLLRS